MDQIEIKRNGDTVSRVVFARKVTCFSGIIGNSGLVFMVYDKAVERYAMELAGLCPNVAGCYALDNVSEETKTVRTVSDICRWLLSAGADRKSVLLAVGGGIVTDMAGFAASVYMRGIRSFYLPTTLLAQVDAAIGGKTGVNLESYKNIVGTFWQPEYTFVCPEVLETLPERTFADGLAEMLKTFIIDNGPDEDRVGRMMKAVAAMKGRRSAGKEEEAEGAEGIEGTERQGQAVKEGRTGRNMPEDFGQLVAEAASVKAGIVSRDEREGGERRLLNLGHTFAHAIEHCANSGMAQMPGQDGTVSHGEAVAIGLSMAVHLSVRLGEAGPEVAEAVDRCLDICGLPARCPYPLGMLEEAMRKDKKSEEGKVHFILVRKIGEVMERMLDVSEVSAILSGKTDIRGKV